MEKHAHKATLFVKKGVVKLQNVWMRVSCKCRNFRTKLCPGTSYRGIAERACMRIIVTNAKPVFLVPYADGLQGQISVASTMANTPDNAARSTA